jgi:hypothetical protein
LFAAVAAAAKRATPPEAFVTRRTIFAQIQEGMIEASELDLPAGEYPERLRIPYNMVGGSITFRRVRNVVTSDEPFRLLAVLYASETGGASLHVLPRSTRELSETSVEARARFDREAMLRRIETDERADAIERHESKR